MAGDEVFRSSNNPVCLQIVVYGLYCIIDIRPSSIFIQWRTAPITFPNTG